MESRLPKVFTLQEAKITLSYVKSIAHDLVDLHRQLAYVEDGQRRSHLQGQIDVCRSELYAVGCQIKNEKKGLVSFFWLRNNRMAELYWQLGEDDIYYWKAVGSKHLNLLSIAFRKIETKVSPRIGHTIN